MAGPFFPSLIPRYVDENWFCSDPPVDEAAKLNELEANHEVWIREVQYRSVEMHMPHIRPVGGEDTNDDDEDDDEDLNEDDEDDDGDVDPDGDGDIDDGDDIEDEFNESPRAL